MAASRRKLTRATAPKLACCVGDPRKPVPLVGDRPARAAFQLAVVVAHVLDDDAIGRPMPPLILYDFERETLERWVRHQTTAQALALRSRMIL